MKDKLPEKYLEWVPRVSEIVSFQFPFDENSELRFNDWLYSKGIKQKDYMNIAQTWWTEVHLTMENYIEGKDYISPLYNEAKNEIDYWKQWLDELYKTYSINKWKWKILSEVYVRDKSLHFQWTIDIVLINEEEKKVILFDIKTFEIAKKAFWLETKLLKSWQPSKPTDKLKKLALQLSLYAQVYQQLWYEVVWLYWVWLHYTWCYEYKVEQWPDWDIDRLLSSFYTRSLNLPPKFTIKIINMKISIQTPLVMPWESDFKQFTFWNIEIWENDFEWKTCEERIEEWIRLQKHLIKKYKEGNL